MKYLHVVAMIVVALAAFGPLPVYAAGGPSVSECAENPSLEGCGNNGGEEAEVVPSENSEPLWWSGIKLVFALLFVLLLIYGILKFIQKKNKLFSKTRQMENLGGIPLGQNRSVQAVKIGDKVYLLGVGDTVELLSEVADEETKRQLLQGEREQPMTNISLPGSQKNTGKSIVQFQELFSKQLSDMKKTKEEKKGYRGGNDE